VTLPARKMTVEGRLIIKKITNCKRLDCWQTDWVSTYFTAYFFMGTLFSTWYVVRRSRTMTTWNKSWTVTGTWSTKNKSTVLLTSGLNDCHWSFVLKMDTLSNISINYLTFACCKLFLSRLCLENIAGIAVFF